MAILAGSSGCQLNRSFFQMDSNSRVPFFGVDLTPKWPTRSSSVGGVSRLQSDAARSDGAETTVSSESAPAKPLSLHVSPADKAETADAAPVEFFR